MAASKKNNKTATKVDFTATKIVMKRVSQLKPWPRNPKTHPPEQIEALARMIEKFGNDQPNVVDENDVILKGHGRWMASQKLGHEMIPCIVRTGMSDAEKKALVISDNQAPLLGGWDKDLLRLELGDLKRLKFDLALTGFDDVQLVSYMARPQEPTPPDQFPAVGEDIKIDHECPKCGHQWSGSSAPVAK